MVQNVGWMLNREMGMRALKRAVTHLIWEGGQCWKVREVRFIWMNCNERLCVWEDSGSQLVKEE